MNSGREQQIVEEILSRQLSTRDITELKGMKSTLDFRLATLSEARRQGVYCRKAFEAVAGLVEGEFRELCIEQAIDGLGMHTTEELNNKNSYLAKRTIASLAKIIGVNLLIDGYENGN